MVNLAEAFRLYRGKKLSESPQILEFVKEKKDKWTFCAPFLSLQIDICQEVGNVEEAKEVCVSKLLY
jgi:hypothetical protein